MTVPKDQDSTQLPVDEAESKHVPEHSASTSVAPSEVPEEVQQPDSFVPPDGGSQAWIQVVGAFFLWFNTWGLVNAYGAWQAYYEVILLRTSSPSKIAWIGSIQGFLLLSFGIVTGAFFWKGYVRQLVLVGGFLVVFGMMMASLGEQYWQIMLSQGICVGLGMGCLFSPTVSTLSTYFSNRLPAATGVAAAGSGIGGTLYTVAFHRMQSEIGFAWATRVIAFIVLATMFIPMAIVRVRHLPTNRKTHDPTMWTDIHYMVYNVAALIVFMGLWTPFYYAQVYAIRFISPENAFYLLAIMTAASTMGRIIPGAIAARVGILNVLVPCCIISAIVCFCLIIPDDYSTVIATSVFYGFFSGGIISLGPIVAVQLSPARELIGPRIAGVFMFASLGFLIGTPVSGHLLNHGGYDAAWIFGGVMTLVAAAIMAVVRYLVAGLKIIKI